MNLRNAIREALASIGCRGEVAAVSRLDGLRDELQGLVEKNLLSETFYKENLAGFKFSPPPEMAAAAASVIITATPQPISEVRFDLGGQTITAVIPPTYIHRPDTEKVRRVLEETLHPAGYRLAPASLPMKLLAACCGLGVYGRNNIFYIPGEGSFFRLNAFYSDLPCREDHWQQPRLLERCENCTACLQKCPTGAITADRTLIRADRCLTLFNESKADFPEWIDAGWHNALIGCMACQAACPENRESLKNTVTAATFFAEETAMILENRSPELLPDATRKKMAALDMLDYYRQLPRNLRALLDK